MASIDNTSDTLEKKYRLLDAIDKAVIDYFVLLFQSISEYNFSDVYLGTKKTQENRSSLTRRLNLLKRKGLLLGESFNHILVPQQFALQMFPEIINQPGNIDIFLILQKNITPSPFSYSDMGLSRPIGLRDKIALFFNEDARLVAQRPEIEAKFLTSLKSSYPILEQMIDLPVYHPLLYSLHDELLVSVFVNRFSKIVIYLKNPEKEIAFIHKLMERVQKSKNKSILSDFLAYFELQKGNVDKALSLTSGLALPFTYTIHGLATIFSGDFPKGVQFMAEGQEMMRRLSQNKTYYTESLYSVFMYFGWIVDPSLQDRENTPKIIRYFEKNNDIAHDFDLVLIHYSTNNRYMAEMVLEKLSKSITPNSPLFYRFAYVFLRFVISEQFDWNLKDFELRSLHLDEHYPLIAREIAFMIEQSSSRNDDSASRLTMLNQRIGYPPLLTHLKRQASWEVALNGLLNVGITPKVVNKHKEDNRIGYFVDFERNYLQPVLQSFGASGKWSKGRNIALKRLQTHEFDFMTEQDMRIATAIKQGSTRFGANDCYFDWDLVLPELAGHPLLFRHDNADIAVELIKSQPELTTEKNGESFILKIDITETEEMVVLKKETNTRYKLIVLTEQQLNVIRAIGTKQLVIPADGKEKLLKTIGHLSGFMTIHSDLVQGSTASRTIEADSRIRVQIIPVGDTLKAELFVKPFGNEPPYAKPGKGGQYIYGSQDGEKCQALRNLKLETEYSETLINAISEADDIELMEGPQTFDDPHDCLLLLEAIAQYPDIAVIEWPEGERFRVQKFASFNQLIISVKGKGYWFDLEGELRVDENTVLTLRQLIQLSQKSHGRFVELGKGEFLALTAELKKRIDEISSYTSIDKEGIRMNKFAALGMADLEKKASTFQADKQWKEFKKKIKDTEKKTFEIPETLDAELRPYQEEGFRWMARLAEWEAGACLADDMGLGKTVQSIALLLHRAEAGPALVVCPASVAPNWLAELRKFAPTLRPIEFRNGNRMERLQNLAPFDVLISTYGLIQTTEEHITAVDWATVILDEAHAIKNTQTKTSKSVMNLKARFRLVLTGTPLQNHLGELWNLFNFVNPGLLGTNAHFNEHFVTPVVKYGDNAPKQLLKKLISPFILRRTKNTVLDELPPKTEITHTIELSDAEMAFYEALRRDAIENIENDEGPTGQKHLKALAEITRLRQACCNPRLVNANIDVASSKLSAFFEIVDELLENKHRALVFSQFVGHLAIVRAALEKRGITYQYLDGSTAMPKREAAVKDFQAGKSDLFLISLKAGGLGLNLTAADYVIHLDPWWNPAIEDQASDRAHRIGQNRPVTIYRLVAQNTIEEKILKLHATKRDMADSLLEGTDHSAKLNTNDLLALLKEM